jgi:hypothetical protein
LIFKLSKSSSIATLARSVPQINFLKIKLKIISYGKDVVCKLFVAQSCVVFFGNGEIGRIFFVDDIKQNLDFADQN